MAPTVASHTRKWSGAHLDLSREKAAQHQSLRSHRKARRDEPVVSPKSASGDESDDDDEEDHHVNSDRLGAQELSPSLGSPKTATPTLATTSTPETLTAATTPGASTATFTDTSTAITTSARGTVATTLPPSTTTETATPGLVAHESTSVPVVTLTSTHLHATTTIVVPLALVTSSSTTATTGQSTDSLPITLPTTAALTSTSTALAALPTDTTGLELNLGDSSNTDGRDGNDGNNGNNGGGPFKEPPHAQDHAVEHALISIGSIGAFITVCFLFFALRAWRKRRREREQVAGSAGWSPDNNSNNNTGNAASDGDGDRGRDRTLPRAWYGLQRRVADWLPSVFVSSRRGNKAWQKMADEADNGVPPLPVASGGGGPTPWMMRSEATPARWVHADEKAIKVLIVPPPPPPAVVPMQQPAASLDPIQAEEKIDRAQRRKTRDSDTSSLSSGFGDGVTVFKGPLPGNAAAAALPLPPLPPLPLATAMTPLGTAVPPVPPTPADEPWTLSSYYQQQQQQQQQLRASRAPTTFTEASDDGQPHRFRTVASWVRQQAGRLQQPPSGGDAMVVSDGRRLDV